MKRKMLCFDFSGKKTYKRRKRHCSKWTLQIILENQEFQRKVKDIISVRRWDVQFLEKPSSRWLLVKNMKVELDYQSFFWSLTLFRMHVEIQLQRKKIGIVKEMTLEHVLAKSYNCYKARKFLGKNDLAKSLFWHETTLRVIFSKV